MSNKKTIDTKSFFKLDKDQLQDELLECAINDIDRAVQRRTMALEDIVSDAKKTLSRVSNITTLKNFDAAEWVTNREEAITALALAEAELEAFKKSF